MTDLRVENHGSIFLLRPVSELGDSWINEHIPEDAMHLGDAVAIEHRFIHDIVAGAIGDGLTVE
jgi:hypothetical protein